MIRYDVADAPLLPETDGIQQLEVPADGILETSSSLEIGWRRDRFFWRDADGSTTPIPPLVRQEDGPHIYLHQHQYFSRSYMDLAQAMPAGQDTTLSDGTQLEKFGSGMLTYEPGRKSLEHIYLTQQAQPLQFQPPNNPRSQALESIESREIPAASQP